MSLKIGEGLRADVEHINGEETRRFGLGGKMAVLNITSVRHQGLLSSCNLLNLGYNFPALVEEGKDRC